MAVKKIKKKNKIIYSKPKEQVPALLDNSNAHFLCSAGKFDELPPKKAGLEFCVLGRSNVGKSSFINHVLENKNIARVSKKPGKTNLANYIEVNDQMIWVDLPGYGYARASHSEKERWSKLINDYCEKRTNLAGIIWLVDIRHANASADIEAFEWFCTLEIPLCVVLTKSDKIPQSQQQQQIQEVRDVYNGIDMPILYSTLKHSSRIHFWRFFQKWLQHYDYCDAEGNRLR